MGKVALVVPCYGAVVRPVDTEHAMRVLRALGEEVEVVDGVCCGQPAFNSGYREEAKDVGTAFLREAQRFDAAVMASGSCVGMVRHYLPGLFEEGKRAGAERIGRRVWEFTSYVAQHPSLGSLGLRMAGTVTYHDSCHARREMGISEMVLGVLEAIEGLDVRRLSYEEECCGFGGTFSVKLPEVSVAMMTGKLADVSGTGARVLVSTDLSCLAHLQAGAEGVGMRLETWTVAELLSRALP
ncbi:MAG TPA: (Fe-S)-binding protein [Tepidiformaceae bacterium]|nr:(Fe-S)-binding protein [Tepidiformaceae bacterium]